MIALPIPMIVSFALAALLARALLRRDNQNSLMALIGVCAIQSMIIALHGYYGLDGLRAVQPLVASFIPPMAWFAFRNAAGKRPRTFLSLTHALGPISISGALLVNPSMIDLIIPALFAGYGIAILVMLSRGEEVLPNTRLESGNLPLLAWRGLAASLVASAFCDVAIILSIAAGAGDTAKMAASAISSVSLLTLGVLSYAYASQSMAGTAHEHAVPSVELIARDQAVIGKLDDVMERQKPYLDPDLTLLRLARKITVPAKDLSAAINRIKGENVSRHVNRCRVEYACGLIANGQSVTAAMYDSGFQTKSNFNREFLRVKGMAPTAWLEAEIRTKTVRAPS